MTKTPKILLATVLAVVVFSTTRHSFAPHQPTVVAKVSPTEVLIPESRELSTIASETGVFAPPNVDQDDPDASLPSEEEILRAARSDVFNFKHHLCRCQCDLDEKRIMKVITQANLQWPRIQSEILSAGMEHNLKMRETEAMAMVDKDPIAAVKFMEAQIQYEYEKYITSLAAAPWRESVRVTGTGDSGLFAQMLAGLPDRYFDLVVDENLTLLCSSSALVESTLANAFNPVGFNSPELAPAWSVSGFGLEK